MFGARAVMEDGGKAGMTRGRSISASGRPSWNRDLDGKAVTSAQARSTPLRGAMTAAKFAISLGLIAYLLSRYSPSLAKLSEIRPIWCVLAFLALSATLPVAAERWRRIVLHVGGAANRWTSFRVFAISAFFGQVLPSVGGDLVRVAYHRLLRSSVGALLISIVLDRGMGIMGLLVLVLGSYPLLSSSPHAAAFAQPAGAVAAALLVAAGVGTSILPRLRTISLWNRVPPSLRATSNGVAWAVGSAEGLFRLLPLSVLVHLLSIVAVYAIGRSLQIDLSFWTAAGVSPLILLAQILPISIGGWGIRETAAVTILTALGVDPGAALALSLIFGTLFALATLPGLLFWFTLRE